MSDHPDHEHDHPSDPNADLTTGPMILVACLGLGGFLAMGNAPVEEHDAAAHAPVHAEPAVEEPHELTAPIHDQTAQAEVTPTPDDAAAAAAAAAMKELEAELAGSKPAEEPEPAVVAPAASAQP